MIRQQSQLRVNMASEPAPVLESSGEQAPHEAVQVDTGRRLRLLVTVEPVMFLFAFGCTGIMPTLTALAYRKTCLSRFNGSLEICDNLDNETYSPEENEVQAETAIWLFRINLCYEIPSIISCFFYGSISDNVSRKLALLLPAIGQTLSCTSHMLQSIYMDFPVGGMLIGPVISGSCGGWISSNMASFSYISDVTSEEKRTFRIAIGEAVIQLGVCLAFLVYGVILDRTSFTFCLAFTLGVFVTIAVYILAWVREPPSQRPEYESCGHTCKALCTPKNLKDSVGCIFKKRDNYGRMHVLLCFAALIAGIIGSVAPLIMGYLYVRKQPLSWSNTLYGVFAGYSLAVGAIGAVGVLPILKDRFHLRETTILLLAHLSTAAGCGIVAFSTRTWMMFAAASFACLAFCQFVILRSLLSKLVEKNELGRVFAMFGSMQSVSGMIANSIYNVVYAVTLHFWAGFTFLLGACLMIIPATLAIILRYCLKKHGWKGDALEKKETQEQAIPFEEMDSPHNDDAEPNEIESLVVRSEDAEKEQRQTDK